MAVLRQMVSGAGLTVQTAAGVHVATVTGFFYQTDDAAPTVFTMSGTITPAQFLANNYKLAPLAAVLPANALCVTDSNRNYLSMVTSVRVPANGGPPTIGTVLGEIPPAVWVAENYRLVYFPDL